MTWGRPAIEKLFGGLRACDICLKPAIAFHLGQSRCEDHLTGEMTVQRLPVELQGKPGLAGKPEVLQL